MKKQLKMFLKTPNLMCKFGNCKELRILKVVNIEWDTNSLGEAEALPSELVVPEEMTDDIEAVSDWLSDLTGFFHKGFVLCDS